MASLRRNERFNRMNRLPGRSGERVVSPSVLLDPDEGEEMLWCGRGLAPMARALRSRTRRTDLRAVAGAPGQVRQRRRAVGAVFILRHDDETVQPGKSPRRFV